MQIMQCSVVDSIRPVTPTIPGVLSSINPSSSLRHDACCKTAPCSASWFLTTTMSSRRFPWFPLLVPKKFKVKDTKSKVSNLNCGPSLTINGVQDLPKNEVATVSATNECTSVEDRVLETNSKAAVRRLAHILRTL